MLAAVLPRPIAAASSRRTETPTVANVYGREHPGHASADDQVAARVHLASLRFGNTQVVLRSNVGTGFAYSPYCRA